MNEFTVINNVDTSHNAPDGMEAFRKAFRSQASLAGKASQVNEVVAALIVEYANRGIINEKDHLEAICQDWQNFWNKGATGETANDRAAAAAEDLTLSSEPSKKQATKFRTWFKLGALPIGIDSFENLRVAVRRVRRQGHKPMSTIEQMLTGARKQIEAAKADVKEKRDIKCFGVEDYVDVLCPDEADKKQKSEMDLLTAALKQLQKIQDGTEGTDKTPPKPAHPSAELAMAIEQVEQRIGTLKAKFENEQSLATLRKNGVLTGAAQPADLKDKAEELGIKLAAFQTGE